MKEVKQLLSKIARKHLLILTLEPRHSDILDFYDVSVWAVEAALKAAYEAGSEAAKYTPGPWEVSSERDDSDGLCVVQQATGGLICLVESTPGYAAADEANARLIATAPELRDALEGLLSERLRPENALPFTERDVLRIQSAERKARDIIAKAKGE